MSIQPRRGFLKESGAAVLTASSYSRVLGAGDRLRVGLIGCGGMMRSHLTKLLQRTDVEITGLCEVDSVRLGQARDMVQKKNGKAPSTTKDMRDLLAGPVDAVFIATPDHWHTPASLLALEAGKHVYVEKPCSHNLREGRLLVEAARRVNKVVQTGTQSRSTRHVQEAMQALREGIIGEVLVAKAWNSQRRGNIGRTKPSDPPASLDFDLWLGPAPQVPFRANMLPGIWRWWYDYGVGDIGNDGVHDIDIARWGLGVERHPDRVAALGGKYFFDDDQQFPDTQYVVFEYEPKGSEKRPRQLIFEQRIWSPYFQEGYENGNAFYGTKGVLILGKNGGWRVEGERNRPGRSAKGSPDLQAHHDNFLACVKSGQKPHADAEIGAFSAALCHLANIATRVGRQLRVDPAREQILHDEDANAMLRRKYREGHWAVPKSV
ncbi:MAG: Gfo/Idh/MocA family protein [Gemmataceae bacterium]